jgi:hypothetical protein
MEDLDFEMLKEMPETTSPFFLKDLDGFLLSLKEKRNQVKQLLIDNPGELIKNFQKYIQYQEELPEKGKIVNHVFYYFKNEITLTRAYSRLFSIKRKERVFKQLYFDKSLKRKQEEFIKREKKYLTCEEVNLVDNFLVAERNINNYLISCHSEEDLYPFLNPVLDFAICENRALVIKEEFFSLQRLLIDNRFSEYDKAIKSRKLKQEILKAIIVQIFLLCTKMKSKCFNHGNLSAKSIKFSIEDVELQGIKYPLLLKLENFRYSSVDIGAFRLLPENKEIDLLAEEKSFISEILIMKSKPSFCRESTLEGDYCPEKSPYCSNIELCNNSENFATYFVIKEEAINSVNALRSINVPSFSALEFYIMLLIIFRQLSIKNTSVLEEKLWKSIWIEEESEEIAKRLEDTKDEEDSVYLYFRLIAGLHLRCNILEFFSNLL